jgi:signal transduction histidine kinase
VARSDSDFVAPRAEWDRLELLADLGRLLSSSDEPEVLLDGVARLVVPRLATSAELHLWEEGRLRPHEFGAGAPTDPVALTRVVDSCVPLLTDGQDGPLLVVPMIDTCGLLGTLSLHAGTDGRTFGARDLTVAMEVATRTASAVQHARRFQQAQEAIRWRDDVLAIVTHDLRNPLNAIAIDLGLLRRPWSDPSQPDRREGRGQLESIKRSLERVGRMVDDLLVASTMKGGHLQVSLAPHPVHGLMNDLVQMLAPMARHRAISLEVSYPAEMPLVQCDRDRALQVLSNLVGNALAVSPRETAVQLEARHEGNFTLFSVSDRGPGVAPPLLERVFERAWHQTTGAHAGFGLGLFIVKGLVEAHGGRVWAEQHLGGGATFCFTLPVAQGLS